MSNSEGYNFQNNKIGISNLNSTVHGTQIGFQDSFLAEGDTYNQSDNVGIGHMSGGEIKEGAKVTGVINKAQKQSLVQAAAEIQELLKQLEQSYATKTLTQKAAVAEEVITKIKADPNWKQKVINAVKVMGTEAFMELIDNPVANVLRAGIEELLTDLPIDNISKKPKKISR